MSVRPCAHAEISVERSMGLLPLLMGIWLRLRRGYVTDKMTNVLWRKGRVGACR
ncbi:MULTISPECIES: hypothetical protein [Candidatus Brocadia]|uniref:hypothetical protein n=1 Tax=Candidatus Brocadia TaxID=380240 RepID=UPI0012FF13E1|nr:MULTISPECIES: hypothetical protein [Brocadia]NOG41570.1 hypothetical protein [Planctomycetota bacterium]